jgi:ABC-type lipoprotein export system ATPase subunit
MHLRKIKVTGFRSCLNVRTEMQGGLNVLIGSNGSGKSNFLQALLLLKRMTSANQARVYFENDAPRSETEIAGDFALGDKNIKFRFSCQWSPSERNQEEIIASRQRWNFRDLTGVDKWDEIPMEAFMYFADKAQLAFIDPYRSRRFMYQRFGERALSRRLSGHREVLWDILRYFSSINYYSASQFSDPSKCPSSIELEDEREFRRGPAGRDHSSFIAALYKAYRSDEAPYKKYMSLIGPDGIGLIDAISFHTYDIPSTQYRVLPSGKLSTKSTKKQVVIPQVSVDGKLLSPAQLSEGTFKTLALIFYIITDQSSVIMIEEPEVSIHHGLLNSIIEIIRNETQNKQVIITTHSDYVLDLVEPDCVQLVAKHPEKGMSVLPLTKRLSRCEYRALKEYLNETGNLGDYWREGGLENA